MIDYRIRLLPEKHEVDVEVTLEVVEPSLDEAPLWLEFPAWVPGAYGFMKYSRDVFDLRAFDKESGKELSVARHRWNGFRVDGEARFVSIRYRFYAYDPAWGELVGFVGHDQALLLATRLPFVRARKGPVRVTYDLPAGWEMHHPSGAKSIASRAYEYPSFEALLDTPVACGRFERESRLVRGTTFHFVFFDRAVGYETELAGFIETLTKVAEEAHALFGSFPFEDYTFFFSFDPRARWGLEHANGTTIALGPHALIDDEERMKAIRVSAHELVHAWNACRMKPAALVAPDLSRGAFPDGLWISEGFTRYYEFLLSARAGALDAKRVFSNIVNYARHLEALPAYDRVTLTDSSLATFLNHNRYPGSVNSTIDYYDKGMVVAFDIDATLRTGRLGEYVPDLDEPTLDHVFRSLYTSVMAGGGGFTHDQARAHLASHAEKLGALIEREVESPGGLSVWHHLERLGFAVQRGPVNRLGIVLKDGTGPVVSSVADDGPAAEVGIAPEDEILRVNEHAYSQKTLAWLTRSGAPLRIEVKRGPRVFTFQVKPRARDEVTQVSWQGSSSQLERIRLWFSPQALAQAARTSSANLARQTAPSGTFFQTFSLKQGEVLPFDVYDNFHGIESIV